MREDDLPGGVSPGSDARVDHAREMDRDAKQLKGRVVFAKVNSDDSPQLSQRYAIRSIPTMVRLQKGRELDRRSGALPLGQIVSFAG